VSYDQFVHKILCLCNTSVFGTYSHGTLLTSREWVVQLKRYDLLSDESFGFQQLNKRGWAVATIDIRSQTNNSCRRDRLTLALGNEDREVSHARLGGADTERLGREVTLIEDWVERVLNRVLKHGNRVR
jgi:hypothetical protein